MSAKAARTREGRHPSQAAMTESHGKDRVEPGCGVSGNTPSPCQGTANMVLDLLGELLEERARDHGGHLEIDEVRSIVQSFKSAPGGLSGFYDSTFKRCHETHEPEPSGAAGFLGAVTRLLKANEETLSMGRIETLGLEEIKDALGPKWTQLSGLVHRTAQGVIGERLTSDDCFARSANGGYFICFAQLSAEEAWFKTRSISREIRRRILRQGPVAEALTDAQLTQFAKVTAFSHEIDLPAIEGFEDQELLDLVDERLRTAAAAIAKRAKATLFEIERSASICPENVLTTNGLRSNLQAARLDTRSRSKAEQLLACVSDDLSILSQLDLITLALAADYANRRSRGDQSLLIVDTHLSTLQDAAWADKYVETCASLVGRARQGLVLNLKGCANTTPEAEITRQLRRLAPFSRLRMVTREGPCRDRPRRPAAPVHLLAVDYGDIPDMGSAKPVETPSPAKGAPDSSVRILVDNAVHGSPIHQLRRFGAAFFTYETG